MKIGYFTMSFGSNEPMESIVKCLSNLGYDGFELCTWKGYPMDVDSLNNDKIRKMRQLVEDAGLVINVIGGHIGYIEPNEKLRKNNVNRTKRNIDLAVDLGARVVDTFSGVSPKGFSEKKAWEMLVESISECADYASERDIIIGFEPHIGLFIDTPEKMLHLISLIESPSLKVNFDVSHFAILGLEIPKVIRKLSEHIVHTHLKDVKGVYPDFQFCIPGEGELNIKEFILSLKESGYDGFVTSEISGMRQKLPGYDPYFAAELTYKTVSAIFKELKLK